MMSIVADIGSSQFSFLLVAIESDYFPLFLAYALWYSQEQILANEVRTIAKKPPHPLSKYRFINNNAFL